MDFEIKMPLDGNCPPESPLYGRSFEVDLEHQEYTSLYGGFWEDDPDWEYTDSRGHEHYRNGSEFPTLRKVEELVGPCGDDVCMCHDDDWYQCYTQTIHECIGCGEYVKAPGKRFNYGPRLLPGQQTFYLDGEYVSHPEMELLLKEHNRIVERIAGG